jgi:hypothetical protein
VIHIIIPEGLNRLDCTGQPLSDYYEACLRRVARMAANGEAVYLAPGNAFGHADPEDEIAAGFLRQLRPDLVTHHVGDARRGYLDTLDNAVWLREWVRRHNRWPMAECWLYCNRYHVLRTWLCFRAAGYRARRIVACAPPKRRGLIVPRLKYYDYPAANLVYEALAIGYTFLRLAGNFVRTGSLLPAPEVTS